MIETLVAERGANENKTLHGQDFCNKLRTSWSVTLQNSRNPGRAEFCFQLYHAQLQVENTFYSLKVILSFLSVTKAQMEDIGDALNDDDIIMTTRSKIY